MRPWPEFWPLHIASNKTCDVLVGRCCCGATHLEGEFTVINDRLYLYGKRVNVRDVLLPKPPLTVDDLEKQIEAMKDQIFKLKRQKRIADATAIKVILMSPGDVGDHVIYCEKDTTRMVAMKRALLETTNEPT